MANEDLPVTGTDPISVEERAADPTPNTANERVQDKSLRHQIGVRRFASHEVNEVFKILKRADRELRKKLEARLKKLAGQPPDFTSRRFQLLREDIQRTRNAMMRKVRKEVRERLVELAEEEQDFEKRIFETSVPVELEYATASTTQLASAIRVKPFAGGTDAPRTLQQWFDSVAEADQARILEAIRLGIVEQESVDQIVSRIRGTRVAAFQNGTAAQTRRNVEAVVRTAVNHVANVGREEFWKENEDIILAVRWTGTLDGRTSAICAGRDGKFAPIVGTDMSGIPEPHLDPPTARPPAHPNCRSVIIAILDPEGVEQEMPARPFVVDTRTGRKRQKDFRAETRDRIGHDKWRKMSKEQRNAEVKATRTRWAEKNIGTVPSQVNYDTWLRRQSTEFQNEVLGPTRGKAFRKGMKVDQFTDRSGETLTLDELRAQNPEFF